MFVEAFIVTSLAIGFGWLIWQHWHSILAGLVPIVLIFGRALRWRRVVTSMDRRNPPS